MKIKILLFWLLTTFLVWCSIQTPKFFTFDEYNSALNKQINDILSVYSDVFFWTWDIDQLLQLEVDWKNSDSDFNLNMDLFLSIDTFTQNYSSQINYNANILQKPNFQKINSSWKLYYSNIDYTPFFYLDQFDINMWTGNIEVKLIKTISSSITNKRILIDIQNQENIIQKRVDINKLILNIQKINLCNVLYPIKKTVYNANYVYKIWIDINKLQQCLNKQFDYSWIVLESFLRWKSNKQASFEIKKLQLPQNPYRIKWTIIHNKAYLEILDNKNNIISKLNIQKTKDKTRIVFEYWYSILNIDLKQKNESIYFKWKIVVQQNNNSKKILFDLEWNLYKQKLSNLIIKQPSNYIIMSQLLWDKFSLQNLLWNIK